MLIEQPPHIDRGHRRRDLAGAEPRELQPRAVIVLGVGVARLLPGRDRAGAVAEIVANGAEREPGGGEGGRELDRLRQDIGGAGEVAAARRDRAPTCSGGRRSDRRRRRTAVHLSLASFTAYLRPMRPEDILVPTPAGVCCKLGGFHIDPDAAGRQGADHARPFRPRARRPRRGAGDAGDARSDAAALRREFRRRDAGDPLRRDA